MAKYRWTSTFLPAMIGLGLIGAVLWILAVGLSREDVALTWIVCLTGYLLGIPLGLLASPYKNESTHFRVLGGLIATFASGYVLSELEEVEWLQLVGTDLAAGRALLFVAFLVLGAVMTFVFRRYSDQGREKDVFEPPPQKADAAVEKK